MNLDKLDSIFSKYLRIWIWSIVVSINASLSYNFVHLNYGNWKELTILPLALHGIAITLLVFSWMSLYLFLNKEILPLIFDYYRKDDSELKKRSANSLKLAFYFMIVAFIIRMMIEVVEIAYRVNL